MDEYGDIPVRFYNFRYCGWYRWFWVLLVIMFFLSLEYVILTGGMYLIVITLFLSILSLFMAFYTWKFRLRIDLKDGILEFGGRRISLKDCTFRLGRKFFFRRIIIMCEDGSTVILSSIVEDFDRLTELLRKIRSDAYSFGGYENEDEKLP